MGPFHVSSIYLSAFPTRIPRIGGFLPRCASTEEFRCVSFLLRSVDSISDGSDLGVIRRGRLFEVYGGGGGGSPEAVTRRVCMGPRR
jgi:hypothetical protein